MLFLTYLSELKVSADSIQIYVLHGFERNVGGRNNEKERAKGHLKVKSSFTIALII